MSELVMPINNIGEENWIENLTKFLENYDVEVEGIDSFENSYNLPNDILQYYLNFGGIESNDFMYNLYKPSQFVDLFDSDWSFIKENYKQEELKKYFIFCESPGNDPVCFNKENFSIYLFSHDPLREGKVFENFENYLRYEIIELQKLMGDVSLSSDEQVEYFKNLKGDNID
jgi:hypothetical protein